MKGFTCSNGKIIVAAGTEASVDEIIAFLEQHRGKTFYNGGAEGLAFCIDPVKNTVSCDEMNFFLDECTADAEEADAAVAYFYG